MKIKQNEKVLNKYEDYIVFVKAEMSNIASERRWADLANYYGLLELKEDEEKEIENYFYSLLPASWLQFLGDRCWNSSLKKKKKIEILSQEIPFKTNLPEIAKIAHLDGALWGFDGLSYFEVDNTCKCQYVATSNGRLQVLLYSGGNILQMKDLESEKLWEWEDQYREFCKYGTYID